MPEISLEQPKYCGKRLEKAFLSTSTYLPVYLVPSKSTEINGGFLRLIHVSVEYVEPVDLFGNVYWNVRGRQHCYAQKEKRY